MKKNKIEIPGWLGNRRIKIVVTNPVADDEDYARNVIKHFGMSSYQNLSNTTATRRRFLLLLTLIKVLKEA